LDEEEENAPRSELEDSQLRMGVNSGELMGRKSMANEGRKKNQKRKKRGQQGRLLKEVKGLTVGGEEKDLHIQKRGRGEKNKSRNN